MLSSCFKVLCLFLAAHSVDPNQKLGWFLSDNATWTYTWFTGYDSSKSYEIDYFVIDHGPEDGISTKDWTPNGKCKLSSGKTVSYYSKHFLRDKK